MFVYTGVFAVVCACVVSSCRIAGYEIFDKKDNSPVLARVGKDKLTLNELNGTLASVLGGAATDEQKIAYVKQWIDNEVLYQTALSQRLDRDSAIRAQMEFMRRNILSVEMMSRMYSRISGSEQPSDSALNAYYEANKSTFTRTGEVARYAAIVMPDLASAWMVRNQVTVDNFFTLGKQYSKVPLPTDPASIPFSTADQMPKPIADVVFGIKAGGTTSPIGMPDGYYVVRVLEKQHTGDIMPLPEVKDRIIEALSVDTRKLQLDKLMADLRQKVSYEYNFGPITGRNSKGK